MQLFHRLDGGVNTGTSGIGNTPILISQNSTTRVNSHGNSSSSAGNMRPPSTLIIVIAIVILCISTTFMLIPTTPSETQSSSTVTVHLPNSIQSWKTVDTVSKMEILYQNGISNNCAMEAMDNFKKDANRLSTQVTAIELETGRDDNGEDNLLLFLHKPRRPFHGNHWYHYGEHYLSQRREVQRLLSLIVHSRQHQQHGGSHRPLHLYLLTNEKKNFYMATPMSFFFAMITAWIPGVNTVSFVYSTQSMTEVLDSTHSKQEHVVSDSLSDKHCLTLLQEATKKTVLVKERTFHFDHSESIQRRFTSDYSIASSAGVDSTTTMTSESQTKWFSLFEENSSPSLALTGQFIGSIGADPIPSTEWFTSHEETQALQLAVGTICEGSQHLLNHAIAHSVSSGIEVVVSDNMNRKDGKDQISKPLIRILIYQRNEKRKLLNIEKLWTADDRLNVLRKLYPSLEIMVVDHDEDRNPCLIYQIYHQADILITSHGFQLTGLLFMRPSSSVFEVFPYKYFKPSYFPLVEKIQLRHQWFQSMIPTSNYLTYITTEACMVDQACRSFARTNDIVLTEDNLNTIQIFIINIMLGFTPPVEPPLLKASFFYPTLQKSVAVDVNETKPSFL